MPIKGQPIPWPRILAEGAAIVVSILLAFAIDAAWQHRGEIAPFLAERGIQSDFYFHLKIIFIDIVDIEYRGGSGNNDPVFADGSFAKPRDLKCDAFLGLDFIKGQPH